MLFSCISLAKQIDVIPIVSLAKFSIPFSLVTDLSVHRITIGVSVRVWQCPEIWMCFIHQSSTVCFQGFKQRREGKQGHYSKLGESLEPASCTDWLWRQQLTCLWELSKSRDPPPPQEQGSAIQQLLAMQMLPSHAQLPVAASHCGKCLALVQRRRLPPAECLQPFRRKPLF